jgi:hypothetical protein
MKVQGTMSAQTRLLCCGSVIGSELGRVSVRIGRPKCVVWQLSLVTCYSVYGCVLHDWRAYIEPHNSPPIAGKRM